MSYPSTMTLNDYDYREPITGLDCYELWLDRVNSALDYRRERPNGDEFWKKYYRLFSGDHWDSFLRNDPYYDAETPKDRITVNLTLSIIEDTLAFLVNTYPKFAANPETMEDILAAKLQPAILNSIWKSKELNQQIISCLKDALIIGHCICETGYTFEIDDNPKNLKKDGVLTYNDIIRKEEPFIRRVNPFRFVFDPEAEDYTLNSARWCAEILFIPLNDLFANTSYSSTALNAIKNGEYAVSFETIFDEEFYNQVINLHNKVNYDCDNRRVVCYKIYDKKYKKFYLLAKGVPIPLIEKPWPYDYLLDEGEGFPYEMYNYITLPNESYGVGIPWLIEDQQLEIDRNVTYMFLHKRAAATRKYLIRQGLDPEDVNKLKNGGDLTFVEVPNPSSDVVLLPSATISADVFNTNSMAENYIRQLTGSDQLMRGGALPSRTTAQEINARSSIAGLKLESKVANVKIFICNIAYKVLSHIRNNMVTQQVVELVGEQGNFWQNYSRDDLSSRITLSLEQISAERIDPMMDRQQAIQTFQMITNLIPLLQQAQIPVDIGALIKWLFEKLGQKDAANFLPNLAVITGQPQIMAQGAKGQSPNPQSQPSLQQPQQTPTQPTQDLMGQLMGGMNQFSNMGG